MLKTLSLKKLINSPKLKIKNNGRVYDKEWRMWFDCEEEMQEFRTAIMNAERNTVSYTQEEVDSYFREMYGI